jgi:predicted RNA-binding Zn ribbon-like protein
MKTPSTHEFQFIAGNLALDFVNTIGNRLGEPRNYLDTCVNYQKWAARAGFRQDHNLPQITPRQLETISAVRESLHRIFRSLATGSSPSPSMLAPLNEGLAAVAGKRLLYSQKGRITWRWHTNQNDPDLFLGPVLVSAAELLVGGLWTKLRQCDGETCGWLFLDRSPAGRRRWCSMADCGNRAKFRTFYSKRRIKNAR